MVKHSKKKPLGEPEINAYYELGLEEERLFNLAEGVLERVRTMEILERYLPGSPAVVLDVGGGPGAYSLWLARLGYEVYLVDPVPSHLEQAKAGSTKQPQTPIQGYVLGDARALDFADAFADVVLLLGPLYHLTERADRLRALREAYRCLKPGGCMFAVGISRYASTLSGMVDGHFEDPDFVAIARQDMRDGQHRNPTGVASYFTTSFFHHPDELREEVREAGFRVEALLVVEGPAILLQDLGEQWQDPVRWERLLEATRWLEAEPAVLGVTGHLIAVGVKLGD